MKIDLTDFIKQDLKNMSDAYNYVFLYDSYCDLENHIKLYLMQQLERIKSSAESELKEEK